jgi:hypothetical protein
VAASSFTTATLEPYYTEAHNEIVQPERIDWYLVTKWLPDLGHLGFAVVKALRVLCYYNPKTGVLRNEVEVDMKELAQMVGSSAPTLYREFERNEFLARYFVQKQEQIGWQGDRPVRFKPRFRVAMDAPIHPSDQERYDLLRAQREAERVEAETAAAGRFRVLPKSQNENSGRKSQNEIKGGRKSQNESRKSQNETPKLQSENSLKELSLPSGGCTKESLRGADAAALIPPINSPGGEETPSAGPDLPGQAGTSDPLAITWNVVLAALADQINKPTLETHLRLARLVSASDAGDVVVEARSHFSREWIDGRHRATVEAALAEALGRPVASLKIVATGK